MFNVGVKFFVFVLLGGGGSLDLDIWGLLGFSELVFCMASIICFRILDLPMSSCGCVLPQD